MRIPTESTGVKVRKEACRSNARRSYLSGRCAHNSKRMLSRAATPPTELGSSGFTVVSAAPATAPLVRPRAAPEAAPPAAPAFARARRSEAERGNATGPGRCRVPGKAVATGTA